jgi:hypothetical protein
MKQNLSQKQEMSFAKKAAIIGSSSLVIALITFFGIKLTNFNDAKATSDLEIDGTTQTLTGTASYGRIDVENGGVLYIEGDITLSDKLEIKKVSKVYIRNGGSLTCKDLKVKEESFLSIAGDVEIKEEFKIEDDDTEVIIEKGFTVSCDEKFEFKDESRFQIAGTFNFTGGEESKVKDDAVFEILNHGTVNLTGSGKFKAEDDAKVDVKAGGWLYVSEVEFKENVSFLNNGYVEQTNQTKNLMLKDGVSMTGSGVFYSLKTNKLKLEDGAKIFGKLKKHLTNDYFAVGSTTISVKRLPKFKIEEDGWSLGDALVVTDTIDLNSKNLDIKDKDFTLPNSFSFNRNGNNSEYIKTSSTGKYKMKILKNDKIHTAPIGRNPYLPINAECEDCEGTEFAMAVTQNVYLDPEQQTGLQSSNAVGETWSVIPDKNFSGDVTFEFQWNAGANGTTNSELTGFNRFNATSYYWVVGTSTQWQTDGTNVEVAVTGSDPYTMQVTFSGMTQGTEYLFSVGSAGTALPVEFTYFDAKSLSDKIELTWGTATETNNDFFEVQRSADGMNWEALEKVNGAGTTLDEQNYLTYDYNPIVGESYYRLRQVDFDGTQDYSVIRKVSASENEGSSLVINSIYPNPFISSLNADISGLSLNEYRIELLNTSGVIIKEKTLLGGESAQLNNLYDVKAGVYFLRVVQGEQMSSKQVIKR